MELSASHKQWILVPRQHLVLLPAEHAIDLQKIGRGLVFIMARWSGASAQAFRALNRALNSFPDLGDLRLYVADTDNDTTGKFFAALEEIPGGYGETYWILDGQVRHELSKYGDDSIPTLQSYTQELLPRA